MADFTLIERCRGCHSDGGHFETVLEMDPMPLAGQFCLSQNEALEAETFPLTWLFCRGCGLVQVGEDVSGESLFDTYNYASSTVPGLVRHFQSYAEFLIGRFGLENPVRLLEIGCNDGVLLNELPGAWCLSGVDPSDVAQKAIRANTPYDLVSAPFSPQLVEEHDWIEKWDVITGSNCLAHISDLREVFRGVSMALKPRGWFWVEVHDLTALLEGSQWDTIYHEHKVEWSVESLQACVESLGFELSVVERLPLHGGVIRCGFQKGNRIENPPRMGAELPAGLLQLRTAYVNRRSVAAVQTLKQQIEAGQHVAAYGASGRANVYLNQLPELSFDFIVDESPLRMNRFIPAQGTPIVSADRLISDQPHSCLVTAWNYLEDITAKNRAYEGQWLSAFPVS